MHSKHLLTDLNFLSRQNLLSAAALIFAIAAAESFLDKAIFQAAVFVALSSISDALCDSRNPAELKPKKPKGRIIIMAGGRGKSEIRCAINRMADAAMFIGFALSGIAPKAASFLALAIAVLLPYWIALFSGFRFNVRRFFHAGLIAASVWFLAH